MSFATKILPRLCADVDNQEWYLEAMQQALNGYMAEIETAMARPQFLVNGITTIPGTPPVPMVITAAPVAKVLNNHIRFNYDEIKSAMYCGDAEQTFPNIFKLFANKLMLNFTTVTSSSTVQALTPFTFNAVSAYTTTASSFKKAVFAIGQSGKMTPKVFHDTLSEYLNMAFKAILPVTVPYIGTGLTPTPPSPEGTYIPTVLGPFNGTVTIAFQQVVL